MKKVLSVLLLATVSLCLFAASWEIGSQGPAGGTVFYSWSEGSNVHYLEASQEFEAEPFSLDISELTSDDTFVGSGLSNSIKLAQKQELDALTAVTISTGITLGEYDDWYLPSLDELKELYNAIGKDYDKFAFWSSSECTDAFAYGFDFSTAAAFASTKYSKLPFIAVREFVVDQSAEIPDVSVNIVADGSDVKINNVTDRIMIVGQILPEDFSFVNSVAFLGNTVNTCIDFLNTVAMVDADYALGIPLSQEVNYMITDVNNKLWSDLQSGLQLMTEYLAYIYGVGELPVVQAPETPVDTSLLQEDQWYTPSLIALKQLYTAILGCTADYFQSVDINDYLMQQQDALYNTYNQLFNGLYQQMMEVYNTLQWAPEPEVEPTKYLMFLCLNNQDELLSNPDLRNILLWGADRKAIINASLGDSSQAYPAWSLSYDESSTLSNDLEKAASYASLFEALPTLDMLYVSDNQEGLAKIVGESITSTTGIAFNYVGMAQEQYYEALEYGDYDVAVFLTDLATTGFLEGTFESFSQYNFGHVYDEAYDALIAQAAEAEPELQPQLYKQAGDYLVSTAAVVPLFFFY